MLIDWPEPSLKLTALTRPCSQDTQASLITFGRPEKIFVDPARHGETVRLALEPNIYCSGTAQKEIPRLH